MTHRPTHRRDIEADAAPAAEPVIETRALTKSFGRSPALRGLDLEVARGEVHGFLGPNGAGKSTAIRVLLGLLKADGGTARLLGGDPWKDVVALHRRLAYVPGDVSLWPTMSGGEAIDLLGGLRGGLDPARRAELIERFELDPTKRGRQYSKGNRQMVALVAALASDAELLILDEPTSGLDPLMENVFQEVVGEAKDRGATVLLSSHILAEVETLADRLSVIRDGRIVRTGTIAQMRGTARTHITATLDREASAEALALLDDVRLDGRALAASIPSDRIGEAMAALAPSRLSDLVVSPPTLESMFLRLYEDADGSASAEEGADAGDAPSRAAEPDVRQRAVEPDAPSRVAEPGTRQRTAEPDARSRTAEPDVRSRVTGPDARSRAVEPDALSQAAEPDGSVR
ncbi:Methionine ABC transporter ATP-binding protein [Brachybacterium nesterenkovii]|uniref:Methionine ABC transporter ATP-binding protein n=1 Tax=Brachybacterium nesterenkovii TaxID=47847 RepID=A0A1X6WSP1_9MICO|nr:Methionine ABC transporter ATP-binding protein [Brachybacterium nesterenkovii]